MSKGLGTLVALLAAVVLAIMATTPPMPQGPQTPPSEFAVARAMPDVVAIAREPHITGTPENARVREYIAARMQALGMEVSTSSGTVGERGTAKRNRWTGRSDPPPTLTNVIGVLPGRNRSLPAVLLMSHHDTVWGSPGAADDTAGIAVSLEVARAIKAGGGAERDLRARARRRRTADAVTFTGYVSDEDLRAIMAAADVAVVPSLYEPFGFVALEAMALGTPLVAARTGGLAEIVEDGRVGRTFTAGDPAALAEVLLDTLGHPRRARALAATARAELEGLLGQVGAARQQVVQYSGLRQAVAAAIGSRGGSSSSSSSSAPSGKAAAAAAAAAAGGTGRAEQSQWQWQ